MSFIIFKIIKLGKAKKINDSWLRIETTARKLNRKNDLKDLLFMMIDVHKPYIAIWNTSFLKTVWLRIGDNITIGDNKKVVEKYLLQPFRILKKIKSEINVINWTKNIGFIFVMDEKLWIKLPINPLRTNPPL